MNFPLHHFSPGDSLVYQIDLAIYNQIEARVNCCSCESSYICSNLIKLSSQTLNASIFYLQPKSSSKNNNNDQVVCIDYNYSYIVHNANEGRAM